MCVCVCLRLTWRHSLGEAGHSPHNLLVALEGDVAADHGEEQDAQRPDGEGDGLVGVRQDPLRWAVHPGTCVYRGRERERSAA